MSILKNKIVGVIGAGTIGCGVAALAASKGYPVLLIDNSLEALELSQQRTKNELRLRVLGTRDPKDLTVADAFNNISFVNSLEKLSQCSFIVENITERIALKFELHRNIRDLVSTEAIIVVNTSCISIADIAALHRDPSRVLGMHFMNPVSMQSSVELIKAELTSAQTLKEINALTADLQLEQIIVNDRPGFVSNRLSHLFMNEAFNVLKEEVASATDIDRIFTECFKHKMGPLATADLIGLDTVLDSLNVLYEFYGEAKYKPSSLLVDMVTEGLLGKKSHRGFFNY
jgi:3-hydroxybutyryl-CoA dehydrogenase